MLRVKMSREAWVEGWRNGGGDESGSGSGG